MHPLLKIILKLIAIIFAIFICIQSYNLVCSNFFKCSPIHLGYIFFKSHPSELNNFFINTNFLLINNNKNVEVVIDYDKKKSRLGEIVKVNLVYKNLTKNNIVAKTKIEYDIEIIEEFVKMFKCPCKSKIKLKPFEKKIVEMEFYYVYPKNKLLLDKFTQEIQKRPDLTISEDLNIKNTTLNPDNLIDRNLIFSYLINNLKIVIY